MIPMRLRLTMASILVVATVNLTAAPAQETPLESIGNRDIDVGASSERPSLEEEIELGRSLAADFESRLRLLDDPVINESVNRVGQRIGRTSDARLPLSFKIIEDEGVNAFALPGGFVYLNVGLLLAAGNEAELASVMAHLVARVAGSWAENRYTGRIFNPPPITMVFLPATAGPPARSAAAIGVPAGFVTSHRGAVEEADFLGIQYLSRAGYDPEAAATFLEKARAFEPVGAARTSMMFATHPPTESRIEGIRRTIARLFSERDSGVVTTSEFEEMRRRLIAYENRQLPGTDEDPTLRRPAR